MSYTAQEAAFRLSRRHAAKGVAELSAAEAVAVADALSDGILEAFRLLPPIYREQDLVFTATPRLSVTCSVVAGSATLAAPAFLASEVGCSVIFASGGDVTWNQVEATDRLRVPWGGATGSATAAVYADAASGPAGRIERLVGDAILLETDGTRRRLVPMSDEERADWFNRAPRIGTPDRYFLEPAGRSSATSADAPTAWLRLWPMPAVPVRVMVRCAVWPSRLRATDLVPTITLPLPIAATEDMLDLCGPRLAVMPNWQQVPFAAARLAAERAEQRLRAWPTALSAPRNRVLTPLGY